MCPTTISVSLELVIRHLFRCAGEGCHMSKIHPKQSLGTMAGQRGAAGATRANLDSYVVESSC